MSQTLQDLVDQAVFLSTEAQSAFGAVIADEDGNPPRWDVDFGDRPTLTFQVEHEGVSPLVTRPHFVASQVVEGGTGGGFAAGSAGGRGGRGRTRGTWRWGWDNISEFPAPVVAGSERTRDLGQEHGIAELTTAELTVDEDECLRLVLAAKVATNLWTHYPAPAGGGTTAWLLVQGPGTLLGTPTIQTLVRSIAMGIQLTAVSDHRAAVFHYGRLRRFPVVDIELDEGEEGASKVRILASDGSADLTFDAQNRVVNAAMQLPGSPTVIAQYEDLVEGLPATPEPFVPFEVSVEEAPTRQEEVPTREPEPAAEAPAPQPEPAVEHPEPAAEAPAAETAPVTPRPEPAAEAPTPEPRPEPTPPAPTKAEDTKDGDDKPKKKGFLKRLFGR
ncbi:DUF6882 domain-containing protein [Brevibacterium litoralis]|uniref:DUF6882 domain-containing protein n=1 Tax=Brevibacterium litoralis TaxID=3138935 RepID=UPI0032EBBBFB